MSGTISFNTYPVNQRTHGVFAEIDPQSNGGTQNQRTLIFGQMATTATATASGTAPANVPFLGTGPATVQTQVGQSGQLSLMYAAYYAQDPFGEVWLVPQGDPAGGVAAAGSVTITGTATANGTLSLYVSGQLVAVPIAAGTTGAAFAYSVESAIFNTAGLPVYVGVPSATAGTVTLTATFLGAAGNEIDVRTNYLGAAAGEVTPPGLTVVCVPLAGGQGVPSAGVSTALAALGEKTFDFIVCPYNDATTMGLLATFLNATSGRWSWEQMLYGGVFTAVRGTVGTLSTYGGTHNEYTAQGIGFYDGPDPAWIWAADSAGASATSLKADPGLPLQELVLNVKAPPLASRFNRSIRNTLLYDGISTTYVNPSGQVVIDRMITFYQTNAAGSPDDTWLNTETPYSLVAIIRDMRSFLQATYGRRKLVVDGSIISGGSNMVTSQTILSSALGRYQQYCSDGRAQNYALFKEGARAENVGGGRVNLLLPFILPNQLRAIVMKIAFVANS